jgi:spore germination cell wall hydrolase CwlJ-like protein
MTAVAEVIRRRGSLRGIYGLNAPHVDKEPSWVWTQAKKAWDDSATSDITHGATHFESTDFKTPYWTKGMKEVAHIGKHKFYKKSV